MTEDSYLFGVIGDFALLVVAALVLLVLRSVSTVDPVTTYAASDYYASDFRLTIEDVFDIRGRGLVATGKVDSGSLQVRQRIQIASPDGSQRYESRVKVLEAFHKEIQTAQTGDNVG